MGRLLQTLCLLLLLTPCPCAVITGGDECHPFSHKVPFFGKRQHHTCPCLPNFICSRFLDGRYRCSIDFKNMDF
ncbi:PREDICTED: prokineticin-1-like [Chlamydotis macqueenii]|uniref:prokineticin-1-like n=1 Tax=Chlamydotis macqueenii TaxID=187382 RepID=UPI000529B63E|nr:PREDICTED: prokineticin-1-like [Chlamydotis macqueenii]